jgi:uncharacterized protein YacL
MPFANSVRVIFVVFGVVAAIMIYRIFNPEVPDERGLYLYAGMGLLISLAVVILETQIKEAHPKALIIALSGLLIGLLTAVLIFQVIPSQLYSERTVMAARLVLGGFFGYLGLVVALRYVDRIDLSSSKLFTNYDVKYHNCKILDTSVIIDGRISDISETGFVEGLMVIPRFVLRELQSIADSSDPLRRKRGRRGLDIVKKLQSAKSEVEILERDYPRIRDVDTKLVALGKDLGGKVVTNDFNLNKVAEIQDVEVLNINDLANSLRPVVLPGEEFSVYVLKEGKEDQQGVGYLDDGTMVVVENGRQALNKRVTVTVTSVLQTTAGRMIFTRIKEGAPMEATPA